MAPPQNDYSPNATIITTPGGGNNPMRPKGLISAISDIQQFFVIESQGQDIPAEFLTLEGSLDFFRIGATSGFKEGLFLIIFFPVFSFWLLPFVFHAPDMVMTIMLNSVPYLPIIINTILCIYISRYYVGNLTRKAVNSLFIGRAILLIGKAVLIYVGYYILYNMSTPDRVWLVVKHFGNSEQLYTDYFKVLPTMMPLVMHCVLIMAISSVVPYGSVYVLDYWRRYKVKKNQQIIGN